MKACLALALPAILLAGCSSTTTTTNKSDVRAAMVSPATPEQQEALLGKLKTLEGKWAMKDEKGNSQLACVFQVSSGGHVVREIMFPGDDHEMTNLYHMDGKDLVMTHYCAVGNQPRMRATSLQGNKIVFNFDSVTNHTSADQTVMKEMTIVFKDKDTIVENWRTFVGEEPAKEHAEFTLTRIK